MPSNEPLLLKRLVIWTASGMIFVGAAVAIFRASAGRANRQPLARAYEGSGLSGGPDHVVGPANATSNRGRTDRSILEDSPTPEGDLREDEASLLAALERLERRMASGLSRARESVVALEYTAVEGPPGTRRVATGVVINLLGDVLSVRIDAPSVAPASSTSGNPGLIVARDASGRRHAVQWVAADPESGLTLLRIAPRAIPPITLDNEGPVLGSQVFVVGNPLGLGHSVSRGHVAGLDRDLELGTRQLGGLMQVQAPLYPGDSGAVVANLRGRWLGLIRSGLAVPAAGSGPPTRDNDFGFAIEARDALWVAEQLRTHGRVDRAFLGVRLEPDQGAPALQPELAADDIPKPEGALLRDVLADSPAAQAGLQAGDIVVEINDHPIRSTRELTDRLDRIPAHAAVHLRVVRGPSAEGSRLSLRVQTASRSETRSQLANTPAALPSMKPLSAQISVTPTAAPASKPKALAGSEPARRQPVKTPEQVPASPSPARRSNSAPQGAVPAPLRAPIGSPKSEDLGLTLPRAFTDRLEQFERRLEKLERRVSPAPIAREASSIRNP